MRDKRMLFTYDVVVLFTCPASGHFSRRPRRLFTHAFACYFTHTHTPTITATTNADSTTSTVHIVGT